MLAIVRFGFITAFAVTVAWVVFRPGFDSIAAAVGALAALLASYFLGRNTDSAGQVQNVSSQSLGIQAGKDVKVRNTFRK